MWGWLWARCVCSSAQYTYVGLLVRGTPQRVVVENQVGNEVAVFTRCAVVAVLGREECGWSHSPVGSVYPFPSGAGAILFHHHRLAVIMAPNSSG
ncbi:MAG: hypothetical protein RLZZ326_1893 [Planctomycetota bacterium]|jgi:hypothetical protein